MRQRIRKYAGGRHCRGGAEPFLLASKVVVFVTVVVVHCSLAGSAPLHLPEPPSSTSALDRRRLLNAACIACFTLGPVQIAAPTAIPVAWTNAQTTTLLSTPDKFLVVRRRSRGSNHACSAGRCIVGRHSPRGVGLLAFVADHSVRLISEAAGLAVPCCTRFSPGVAHGSAKSQQVGGGLSGSPGRECGM